MGEQAVSLAKSVEYTSAGTLRCSFPDSVLYTFFKPHTSYTS